MWRQNRATFHYTSGQEICYYLAHTLRGTDWFHVGAQPSVRSSNINLTVDWGVPTLKGGLEEVWGLQLKLSFLKWPLRRVCLTKSWSTRVGFFTMSVALPTSAHSAQPAHTRAGAWEENTFQEALQTWGLLGFYYQGHDSCRGLPKVLPSTLVSQCRPKGSLLGRTPVPHAMAFPQQPLLPQTPRGARPLPLMI